MEGTSIPLGKAEQSVPAAPVPTEGWDLGTHIPDRALADSFWTLQDPGGVQSPWLGTGEHWRSGGLKLLLPGTLGPLLQRATGAVSTGAGCLACTAHATALLLFAFLLLPLLKLLLPGLLLPARDAGIPASQGGAQGWEPRMGSQEQGEAALLLLISPGQDFCFIYLIIFL